MTNREKNKIFFTMEKYAKPVGSGRDFSKRKTAVALEKSGKMLKREKVTEKLLGEEEKEFGNKLILAKSVGFNQKGLIDFASIFQLIPSFQKLFATNITDAKWKEYSPVNKLQLQTNFKEYLSEYEGGTQQQVFDAFPLLLTIGFQQNILAKKELERLRKLSDTNPNEFSSSFKLFWVMYGQEYNPPFLRIEDITSLGLDINRVSDLIEEIVLQIFRVKSIFDIPMYQLLLNQRLAGRTKSDIEKENSGLSKLLSRKLFSSAHSKTQQKPDSCFYFKSKTTKYLTTPSLAFIKTVFDNLNNPQILNSSKIFGKIVQKLAEKPNFNSIINIYQLEKDCQDLMKSSSITWDEKRDEYKNALAVFLEYFITEYIVHSGLTPQVKERMVEHLYQSSKTTSTFKPVTLVLAEMLINELELRHLGYICFYAARSNILTGLSIEISQLAEEVNVRIPDIDLTNNAKDLYSELVEGTCYRPSIAKAKTALEIVTENYQQEDWQQLGTFRNEPPEDSLKELVEDLYKTNPEVAKRKGGSARFIVWKHESGHFTLYWVKVAYPFTIMKDINGKLIDPEMLSWYMLVSVKDDDEEDDLPNVLEVRFTFPTALKSYETLQKETRNPKFKPTRLHQEIRDNDLEQKDRIRSANMSLFANLHDPGESTLRYFLDNVSVALKPGKSEEAFTTLVSKQALTRIEQFAQKNSLNWVTDQFLAEPMKAFKEFATAQDQYLGTILRFAFPCEKVADFVYAAFPYGSPIAAQSLVVGNTVVDRGTEYFPVDQFIRYITVPKLFQNDDEAQLYSDHQVRILDLCFSTFGVEQGVKLDLYKFYPEILEKNLQKRLKSYYHAAR